MKLYLLTFNFLNNYFQYIGGAQEKIRQEEENVVYVPIKEDMTSEEIMDLVLKRADGELPLKEDLPSTVCSIL